jgi:hypothetical protein
MNHEQIDRLDFIDRYLMGKLPAEVSSGFEEHFVDCPQCIARLQTTKNFMHDLRLVAAEQAAQIEPHPPRSAFRQVVTSLFPKPLAWAAALLLIAAATSAVFVIGYTQRLRDEANQAKSLAEQWQRRYEDERQSALAAEAQRAEQLRALEAKLKQQEEQRTEQPAEPERRLPPEGNLPIYILTSVRGSDPSPAEGVNRINLPRSAAIFAFSIALEGETRYETYRITIIDDHRRPIWKSGELKPDRQDALSIWLRTSLFRPGYYSLMVEGYNKEGGRSEVGNYPFLIVKNR